jgi:ATP-binding cassette, subfamily B, bacterial
VPLIKQTSGPHCGVACLAMILRYFGREAGTRDLLEAMAPTRAGSTALSIVQAARRWGLDASGWEVPYDALGTLRLPAVVHVLQSHFVVLEAVTAAGFVIIDPGVGRRLLTREKFRTIYNGTAITFGESATTQPEGNDGT